MGSCFLCAWKHGSMEHCSNLHLFQWGWTTSTSSPASQQKLTSQDPKNPIMSNQLVSAVGKSHFLVLCRWIGGTALLKKISWSPLGWICWCRGWMMKKNFGQWFAPKFGWSFPPWQTVAQWLLLSFAFFQLNSMVGAKSDGLDSGPSKFQPCIARSLLLRFESTSY